MTNEQLVTLIRENNNTAEHMEQLWLQNKAFIYTIAWKYAAYEEIDDLMQQGYLGLCNAVDSYRSEEGASFIHYAAYWIRQSIHRYVEECSALVRIPGHRRTDIRRFKKMQSDFIKYYGRSPSDLELSKLFNDSLTNIRQLKEDARMERIGSLDEPMTEDGLSYDDMLASDVDIESDVLEQVEQEQLASALWGLVDTLPEKEAAVLRMKFQEGKTLEEAGEQIGITQAKARQLQGSAFKKLRSESSQSKIKPFIMDYIGTHAYGGSVQGFKRTGISSTEFTAFGLMERGL